jgi:hypothetical protein
VRLQEILPWRRTVEGLWRKALDLSREEVGTVFEEVRSCRSYRMGSLWFVGSLKARISVPY